MQDCNNINHFIIAILLILKVDVDCFVIAFAVPF